MNNDIYDNNFDPYSASTDASNAIDRERRRAHEGAASYATRDNREAKRGATPRKHARGRNGERTGVITGIKGFFMDKRTRLFAGIALVCVATYLAISAISYFTYGAEDQSEVLNRTISEMSADPQPVGNIGGPVGAFLAQNMVSNGFGVGSLILIGYLFILGWCLLHRRKFSFWSLTMKSLIDCVALSTVAGLLTLGATSWVYWGGIHGYEINQYLIANTGYAGAILVSVLLVSAVVAIYLNELRRMYVAYRKRMAERRARIEAEMARREAEQAAIEETLRRSSSQVEAEETETPEDIRRTETRVTPAMVGFGGSDLFSDDVASDDSVTGTTAVGDAEESTGVLTAGILTATSEVTALSRPMEAYIDDNYESADENSEKSDSGVEEDKEPESDVELRVNADEDADLLDQVDRIDDLYDPTADLSYFRGPGIELLANIAVKQDSVDQAEMEENKERITATLSNYQIPISQIEATVGPTVTLYEIIPAEGVRIAKIKRLEDDIALSLAALGIRIIAPIPGKGTIGIEVPNKEPQMVPIRSVIGSRKFQECTFDLPMAMGATISKDIFIADLTKMPHVLVAGATGQGKSVGLNTIIASLLYKKHPSELKFVLVDPKMVEFSLYAKLEKHYLAKLPGEEDPIITEPLKVVATLNSLCVEMDNRYALLKDANVRSIKEYNAKFINRRLNPEKGHRYLPYIVIVVDEFGDLIMTAGKEVETPIARIAQKARAVGMHMILATQRPSTNVITGIIKANFPGRIAFRVSQMVDSRTILDRPGANQLIGKGDMLFSFNGEIDRVQCAFISTEEVEAICDSIAQQQGYPEPYPLPEAAVSESGDSTYAANAGDHDPLFEEAARFIISCDTASTSSLQRRYSIGYNRAGKIIDQLEAAGVVGPSSGSKPRAVLMDGLQLDRLLESMGIV